jgi:hypothetical protein
VTSRPKLPAHGTIQRYRLELKAKSDGKGKGPCDRCRSANSDRVKTARTNAAARARRSQMSIVPDVTPDDHIESDEAPKSGPQARRRIGAMERAVDADIKEIDSSLQVPFHRSLSVLARQLAKEIDEPSTPAVARSQSSRQLFEVLRSLRTQKEGDDNSAVAVALQATGFGSGPPRLP